MRSRLRLFALVGLVATAIDLGLFLALADGLGRWGADVVGLTAAAVVAYFLNRQITFRGDPDARWVRSPRRFAFTAALAGLVDLAVVSLLGFFFDTDLVGLLLTKVPAIGTAAAIRWTFYRWMLFNTVRAELADRRARIPAPGEVRLSVVIPAFREPGIGATVETVTGVVEAGLGPDFEIVVVDDGSGDDTAALAEAAGARVVSLAENRGKGAAVRAGMLAARGRSLVFTDADLAYPAETILELLTELEDGWDMVVGSRRHDETTTLVRARRLRELGGRAVNWFTHLVLLGHFRDTQCGIKGFRGDIGKVMFERAVVDGFAFDVELFLMAEQDHLSLREVPVSIVNRDGSSVRIVGDTLQLLRDLLRIRRRAGAGGYQPTDRQRLVLTETLEPPSPQEPT